MDQRDDSRSQLEERANVVGDEVGPLEGGEVAAAVEFAPVRDEWSRRGVAAALGRRRRGQPPAAVRLIVQRASPVGPDNAYAGMCGSTGCRDAAVVTTVPAGPWRGKGPGIHNRGKAIVVEDYSRLTRPLTPGWVRA